MIIGGRWIADGDALARAGRRCASGSPEPACNRVSAKWAGAGCETRQRELVALEPGNRSGAPFCLLAPKGLTRFLRAMAALRRERQQEPAFWLQQPGSQWARGIAFALRAGMVRSTSCSRPSPVVGIGLTSLVSLCGFGLGSFGCSTSNHTNADSGPR